MIAKIEWNKKFVWPRIVYLIALNFRFLSLSLTLFFLLRICILILEKERNINVREKHPLVASTRYTNWGLNPQPLAYRTKLQPTKPPGQDRHFLEMESHNPHILERGELTELFYVTRYLFQVNGGKYPSLIIYLLQPGHSTNTQTNSFTDPSVLSFVCLTQQPCTSGLKRKHQ